jgi:hypothetical protein
MSLRKRVALCSGEFQRRNKKIRTILRTDGKPCKILKTDSSYHAFTADVNPLTRRALLPAVKMSSDCQRKLSSDISTLYEPLFYGVKSGR